jgi:hypothetical protein
MKEALLKSKILECGHSDMQLELIRLLSSYKKTNGFERKDLPQIAFEILDFASKRCKNKDLVDSYKVFILDKIKLAFEASLKVRTFILEKDEAENLLDIPDEDFPETITDHEFLAKLGWKHDK